MKKNTTTALEYRIEEDLCRQYNDLFQSPHNVTDISVKDKEWFKKVFLQGENRALNYIREIAVADKEMAH